MSSFIFIIIMFIVLVVIALDCFFITAAAVTFFVVLVDLVSFVVLVVLGTVDGGMGRSKLALRVPPSGNQVDGLPLALSGV